MYFAKCTFTVIIFAIVVNINAGPPIINNTTTDAPTTSNTVSTDSTIPTVSSSVSEDTTTVPSTSTVTSSTSTTSASTSSKVPTTSKVTTSSPNTTEAPHHNRQFDGPSFIGGIVLATGLMAIGFVAFKFYKARTERNYHTL